MSLLNHELGNLINNSNDYLTEFIFNTIYILEVKNQKILLDRKSAREVSGIILDSLDLWLVTILQRIQMSNEARIRRGDAVYNQLLSLLNEGESLPQGTECLLLDDVVIFNVETKSMIKIEKGSNLTVSRSLGGFSKFKYKGVVTEFILNDRVARKITKHTNKDNKMTSIIHLSEMDLIVSKIENTVFNFDTSKVANQQNSPVYRFEKYAKINLGDTVHKNFDLLQYRVSCIHTGQNKYNLRNGDTIEVIGVGLDAIRKEGVYHEEQATSHIRLKYAKGNIVKLDCKYNYSFNLFTEKNLLLTEGRTNQDWLSFFKLTDFEIFGFTKEKNIYSNGYENEVALLKIAHLPDKLMKLNSKLQDMLFIATTYNLILPKKKTEDFDDDDAFWPNRFQDDAMSRRKRKEKEEKERAEDEEARKNGPYNLDGFLDKIIIVSFLEKENGKGLVYKVDNDVGKIFIKYSSNKGKLEEKLYIRYHDTKDSIKIVSDAIISDEEEHVTGEKNANS